MLQQATILLVEDDPNDVLLMQRAFEKARLANPLRIVRDGEEAIDYLAGEGIYSDREKYPIPLLVLLDLKMPKRSGFEVLAWLRSQEYLSSLPVVVLTSSEEVPDVAKAYRLGANSYLVKPAQLDDLVQMMHTGCWSTRNRNAWLLWSIEYPIRSNARSSLAPGCPPGEQKHFHPTGLLHGILLINFYGEPMALLFPNRDVLDPGRSRERRPVGIED
jgi:CheY-like chemotaxis protein